MWDVRKSIFGTRTYSTAYADIACSLRSLNSMGTPQQALIVSAPGKVILHGEHAVVYGKAALATSVDLRCYLVLSETADGEVTLELPDFEHHVKWSLPTLIQQPASKSQLTYLKELSGTLSDPPPTQNTATLVFLYLLTHICRDKLKEFPGVHATVLSTLPASAGLGSSAAFSVCLAAGLLLLVGAITNTQKQVEEEAEPPLAKSVDESASRNTTTEKRVPGVAALPQLVMDRLGSLGIEAANFGGNASPITPWSAQELEVINKWGLEAEKLIHGTPSGIDNSVSTFGGAIRFQSGEIRALQRMPQVRILLVNTKVPRSTKKMVAGVRELHTKYPSVVGPMLESIEAITVQAEQLLDSLALSCSVPLQSVEPSGEQARTQSALQDLFVMNQHLLNALGVGHAALDRVYALARERGLAAKLTGAGGGGCAIVLIPPGFSDTKLTEAKQAFSTAGFECWETTIGSNGVSLHFKT